MVDDKEKKDKTVSSSSTDVVAPLYGRIMAAPINDLFEEEAYLQDLKRRYSIKDT